MGKKHKLQINFFLVIFLSFISFSGHVYSQVAEEKIVRVPVMLPGSQEPQILDVTLRNGKLFLDDDIYLGDESLLRKVDSDRSASISPITAAGSLWPNNTVPFNLTASHPERSEILQAMTHIASRTSITFVPRTNENNFISFSAKDDGCYSNIGMIGGEQFINMAGNCGYPAAIHELGHALGLFHEHVRKDRDEFVNINWNNIISGKESNFQKYIERGNKGIDFDLYDYESIMHYTTHAFSLNGQPTIEVKTPPAPSGTTIGTGRSLSQIDILSLNNLYRPIPRSTSSVILEDEVSTFPNPPCIGTMTEFSMRINSDLESLDTITFQYVLHDFRSGNVVERIGDPFQLEQGSKSSIANLEIDEATEGAYLLVLWEVDENGNLFQLVNDGDYLNGRRIEVVDDCNPPALDPYEENNQELTSYEISTTQGDSTFLFSTVESTIHSMQDIDYYTLNLERNINYTVELEVLDNADDEALYTDDVVVDYKVAEGEWQGFNDKEFVIDHLRNGPKVTIRVRSHFPSDTGSYQLNIKAIIDPEALLQTADNRYTIEATDTTFIIPVESNRNWVVNGEAEWIRDFNKEGFGFDTLIIHCDQNLSFDPREVNISLTTSDGNSEYQLKLIQGGVQRTLSAEYSQVSICNSSSEELFWVNSNASWTASTETPWIELIDSEGEGDGWVRYVTNNNITQSAREGQIELNTQGIKRTVKVNQPGTRNSDACVDPVYIEVSPEEGSTVIDINTNLQWDIISSSESLLMVTPSSGSLEVSYPALDEEIKDNETYRIDVAVQNLGVYTIVIFQTVDFSSSLEDEISSEQAFSIVNPMRDRLDLLINLPGNISPLLAEIRDLNGRLLWSSDINLQNLQGRRFRSEPLSISSGMYIISLRNGNSFWSKKMIKIDQ
ncbi:MAG: T9SS type A sorting domain-containing protein [Saprospiraceae bacterium]|nr:T9SS type A sorting domain-containing protein [Saprospiraceae bacterium]